MNADRCIEMRLGGACLHGDGDSLDNLARIGTDHVRSHYKVVCRVDDQFHEHPFPVSAEGIFQVGKTGFIYLYSGVLLPGLFLRHTDCREIWLAEYTGGYILIVYLHPFIAEQCLCQRHGFGNSNGGKVKAICHVPDGVNG